MENSTTYKGYKIERVGNYEFNVSYGKKIAGVGGLSTFANVKRMIDSIKNRNTFFQFHGGTICC